MVSSSSSHTVESESGNANRASPSQGLIERFPWVTREVLSYRSKLTVSDLESLPIQETNTYSFCLPEEEEPVCSVREGSHNSFFFFYVDYITRLGIHFPFSEFQTAILEFLGVAPSQLHPNGWGYVIAFEWFCKMLGLPCTTSMFFYFFTPHTARSGKEPAELKGWTSIRGIPHRRLFTPVSDSFKYFKRNFFKVVAKSGVQPWFLKGPDSAKVDWEFNLYWCKDHHDVSLSAYKVERSTLLKHEKKAIDAITDHVKAKGTVGAASLVAQYRDEAWHHEELVSRPSMTFPLLNIDVAPCFSQVLCVSLTSN